MAYYVFIVFLGFGGFFLSFYIGHKKGANEKIICPIGADCDAVIHSEYSRFLGVPLEILGMLYYTIITVSYAVFLIFPKLASSYVVFFILAITTSAFLFSLYLTFIQAFTLKQWCTWCLVSAGLSTLIFSFVLAGIESGIVSFLTETHSLFLVFHIFGFALGVGGATITDIFFFKFLKDFRISEWEADTLHTLSQVIWFALFVLVISGLALYIPEASELRYSAKFLVKVIVVAVIIINGALLNLIISPKLVKISFGEKHHHEAGELKRLRKLAFALGAISLTSWYSAFILGSLHSSPASFSTILLIYIVLLFVAIAFSQFMERLFSKKGSSGTV